MTDTNETQKTYTAMDLLATAEVSEPLKTGVYTATYLLSKVRHSSLAQRSFLEHFFDIIDDKNKPVMISVYSSLSAKKSNKPEYDTKLYKIITSLLQRPLVDKEPVKTADLAGKKCKVFIEEKDGYNELTEFYRENEETPYDSK